MSELTGGQRQEQSKYMRTCFRLLRLPHVISLCFTTSPSLCWERLKSVV